MPLSTATGSSTVTSTAAIPSAFLTIGVAVITASASIVQRARRDRARATFALGAVPGGRADVRVDDAADGRGDRGCGRRDGADRHQPARCVRVVVAVRDDVDAAASIRIAWPMYALVVARDVGGREHHGDVDRAADAGVRGGDRVHIRPGLDGQQVAGQVDRGPGRPAAAGARRRADERLDRAASPWRSALAPVTPMNEAAMFWLVAWPCM